MRRKSFGLVYSEERRSFVAASTADLMVAIRSESTAEKDEIPSNRRTRAIAYIRRLESMLEETPDMPIALSDIAQIFHLERTHCCRVFREITGKSFSAWIRGIRIQRALRLLRTSKSSITDVAYTVGYRDITTFERNFRKELGHSPRVFRKLVPVEGVVSRL